MGEGGGNALLCMSTKEDLGSFTTWDFLTIFTESRRVGFGCCVLSCLSHVNK